MQADQESKTAGSEVKSLAALLRSASRGSEIIERISLQAQATCKPLKARFAALLADIDKVELVSASQAEAGQVLVEAGDDAVAVRALGSDDVLIGLFCFQAMELSALVNSMFGSVYEDKLPAPVAATHKAVARELSQMLLDELVRATSVAGTADLVRTYKIDLAGELPDTLPGWRAW
jgi:hypothetical protein